MHKPVSKIFFSNMCLSRAYKKNLIKVLAFLFVLSSVVYAVEVPVLEVVVRDSSVKILKNESVMSEANTHVSLKAARNEAESGQIVLYAPNNNVSDIAVSIDGLKNGSQSISSEEIDMYLLHYLMVDEPTDLRGGKGYWPDALVPLKYNFELMKGNSQAIWFKIQVKEGTKAGIYKGNIKISVAGSTVITVPVELEVWDIDLPKDPTLPFLFGLDFESIYVNESPGISASEFKQNIMPNYYNKMKSLGAYPTHLFDTKPVVSITDTGVNITFDAYETEISRHYNNNEFFPVAIPFLSSWPVDDKQYSPGSNDYNIRVSDYFRKMGQWLNQKGWLKNSYVYIAETDEPAQKVEYDRIKVLQELVKEGDSRLRVVQTYHADCVDCSGSDLDTLDNSNVLWCPNITVLNNQVMNIEQTLFGFDISVGSVNWSELKNKITLDNREWWFYVNPWTYVMEDDQMLGFPNTYIDRQGVEQRVLGWAAFSQGAAALTHWNGTFWKDTSNPWSQVTRGEERNQPNGDGSLMYPARQAELFTHQGKLTKPVASLRLEMIREGAEDHKLMSLLKERKGNSKAMEYCNQVFTSMTDFQKNPLVLQNVRSDIAAELLK